MPKNLLEMYSEIVWVSAGAVALLIFALAIAIPHRPKRLPGSSGHRGKEEAGDEVIRPDGYIDSFANEIEEAGGGMPLVVLVALVTIPLWWLIYLIVGWQPR